MRSRSPFHSYLYVFVHPYERQLEAAGLGREGKRAGPAVGPMVVRTPENDAIEAVSAGTHLQGRFHSNTAAKVSEGKDQQSKRKGRRERENRGSAPEGQGRLPLASFTLWPVPILFGEKAVRTSKGQTRPRVRQPSVWLTTENACTGLSM